ncbi:hypothetical protein [uncultured Gammaproteobacteria bacterium]|jgi:hypothetical protein|nr:hypothetical protein [uncultured Gammaproteobacteria bacterium]CAC9572541.1 hypothetical protein [uncultured Gammaproteobacteria bacterium]CAC9574666.1 hypothetical protein [uncultured Gammaproteobacteria bacterium]CAC9588239.1 hypothetical protein [uncultured Gammaproteobacteria bacterium]CAC9956472.1 hypothetical protein [uncultured Gammaproteobacteria bacterium]
MSKKITNLAGFTPQGALGQMFAQARALNALNQQLSEHLPETFKSLSLCAINDNTATFVTNNQALAFRVQKQPDILLNALKQMASLTTIEKVIVKISLKEY